MARGALSVGRVPFLLLLLLGLLPARLGSSASGSGGPVAPPVVVFVQRGQEALVRLSGFDAAGRPLLTTLVTGVQAAASGAASSAGSVFAVSELFMTQRLQPQRGAALSSFPVSVPKKADQTVVYVAPAASQEMAAFGTARYSVRTGDGQVSRSQGVITFVSPTRRYLVSSDFRTDTEGWKVVGKASLVREAYSRSLLSQYIVGTDGQVNSVTASPGTDAASWRFVAPPKFLGNLQAAYGGQLVFSMGTFSGDFSPTARTKGRPLVLLECASCKAGAGVRLGFFSEIESGKAAKVTVPLAPDRWQRDPKNSLLPWQAVTACELVEALRAVSGVSILGDLTRSVEAVALDDVAIVVAQPWPGIPRQCYDFV